MKQSPINLIHTMVRKVTWKMENGQAKKRSTEIVGLWAMGGPLIGIDSREPEQDNEIRLSGLQPYSMVGAEGLEPSRPSGHQLLRLACLPVPPHSPTLQKRWRRERFCATVPYMAGEVLIDDRVGSLQASFLVGHTQFACQTAAPSPNRRLPPFFGRLPLLTGPPKTTVITPRRHGRH